VEELPQAPRFIFTDRVSGSVASKARFFVRFPQIDIVSGPLTSQVASNSCGSRLWAWWSRFIPFSEAIRRRP
jgi:hypothetical protein